MVETYFRSLAHWPEPLAQIWAKLRPLIGEQAFEVRRDAVVQRASELAAELAHGAAPICPTGIVRF